MLTMDLTSTHPRRRRKLPAEMNREIFLYFDLTNQRKYIWGLGWGFYAMFRHKLLKPMKRVCNPQGNVWNLRDATIFLNGFVFERQLTDYQNIYSLKGFPISGEHFREENFPGTICYYFEVKALSGDWWVGFSDGAIPGNFLVGNYPNSYAIRTEFNFINNQIRPGTVCGLAGEDLRFQMPGGTIRQLNGNVYGCGLLMDPNDKLWIFFTYNGILMGRQIQISPSTLIDHLYPTVGFDLGLSSLEANFGDNPAKPFEYDIKTCPGMGLEWI